jgi:cytochrome c oxidase accessory protein FixG
MGHGRIRSPTVTTKTHPCEPEPKPEPELVSLYQKHAKVYPRAVSGWFATWRWTLVWATQLLFYGLPWLQWNGRPLMLFDLEARRFHVLGLTFFPQDFIFLTALLVLSALALFFFTAVAGRLWCGYACPQTVYTEIFMWLERRIEGDRQARIRLDRQTLGAQKLLRKGAKHLAWLAVALFTGFSFVGYFTPIRELLHQLLSLSLGPWETFWVLFYGAATYGNAGWMREQVCKYMCPYARFQSALIDRDSMVIAYDQRRGDPRGARKRGSDAAAQGLGDCVDCRLCVQVCPTGIDIRNGLQNECIGCAACIDACNQVMDRVGSPRGLIRYATENGVEQRLTRAQMLRRIGRPRVLVYGALLLAVATAFIVGLSLRSAFHVDVVKDRGSLGRVLEDGRIENTYRVHVLNTGEAEHGFTVGAQGLPELQARWQASLRVGGGERGSMTLYLDAAPQPLQALRGQAQAVTLSITRDDGAVVNAKASFYVPR